LSFKGNNMSSVIIAGDTSGTITLQAPAASGSSVLTLPVATDTLVGKATTDTLTNKTLTSPTLTAPALGTPASGDITNLAASQAQQEAGSALTVAVTPGRQQFHPSAAKAWVRGNMAGATGTSYNVTSITDASVGTTVVTFTVPFSAVTYAMSVTASSNTDIWGQQYPAAGAAAVGSCGLGFVAGSRSLTDPDIFYAIFFGDQ
jgi:hypothetical protein